MKYNLILLLLAAILVSFKNDEPKLTAYIFYSDTCPMCIKYVYRLNEMQKQYEKDGLKIIAVFSNYYTKPADIAKFKAKEKPQYELLQDKDLKLANEFDASITPEVVLVNKKRQIIYRGLIDNWFYRPGKYRQVTTQFYLRDAIDSTLAKAKPAVTETLPIGCYLMCY